MQPIISREPGPLNKKPDIPDGPVDDTITNGQPNADSPVGEGTTSTENDNIVVSKDEEKTDSNFPKSEEKKEDILGFEEVSDAVY